MSNDDRTEKELLMMTDLQLRNDSLNNVISNSFNTKFYKKPF